MKWDKNEGYIEYKTALTTFQEFLKIPVDYYFRPELSLYLTKILEYINRKIIEIGEDSDIKTKIQEVFDIFEYGADKIIASATRELASDVGVLEYDEYNQEYFVFAWSNVLSTVALRLKLQYANLLEVEQERGCPCCCGRGEDWHDWEKYTSGIYPEDEANIYSGDTGSSWRVTSDIPECTGCYKQTTNYLD